MKKILTVLAIVLAFSIGSAGYFSSQTTVANAEENEIRIEEKSYCTATLEDDFADDRVLVAINKASTLKYRKYTPEDFADVGCISVEDMTGTTTEIVKQQVEAERTGNWRGLEKRQTNKMLINVDDFRTILCLELRETGKENVLRSVKLLEKREDVLLANPDYFVEFFANPNPTPTYYSSQWSVQKISLPNAWNLSIGKNTVVVGVMDSGIQGTHPDLQGRLATNLCADFTTGTTLTPNPTDSAGGSGHGTLVAGIIGAQRDSGTPGITGVAQNIRLASLKINDPDTASNGTQLTNAISSIQRAITFATNNQIRIINCSTGYRASDSWATSTHRSTLQTAIQGYPGLFVAAAGNEGWNNDTNAIYPANFDLPRLISVGASTSSDSRLSISCYGATSVDIFAPGENIYSANKNGGYSSASGTSLAAPHVAGVAALMLSIEPNLSAETMKTIILNNADKATDGISTSITNNCVSGGRVNAFKAVSAVAFTTGTATGGISITGFRSNFTLPNNTNLTLPDSFAPLGTATQQTVTSIDTYAFKECEALESVTFGSNSQLTIIDYGAFIYCSNLKRISIPSSVTRIGTYVFNDCAALESVTFGSNSQLTTIDYGAFYGCSRLTNITIPATVTSIGTSAFRYCSSLTTVRIERSLSADIITLGSSAFSSCPSLSSIYVPDAYSVAAYKTAANWSSYQSKIKAVTYTVTLNMQGGSGDDSFVAAVIGANMPAAIAPKRSGYAFDGYYTATNGGGTKYYDSDMTSTHIYDNTDIVTLYAKWIVAYTYAITYLDGGGGAFSGTHGAGYPTSHTYGTATTLVNPTKTGYAFGGWFASSDCSGTALTSLSATGYTSNITLYAKWTTNKYSITYQDSGGGAFSGTHAGGYPTTHAYGTTTPLSMAWKPGYIFCGWYATSDCSGNVVQSLSGTGYTGNITLYAKWIDSMPSPPGTAYAYMNFEFSEEIYVDFYWESAVYPHYLGFSLMSTTGGIFNLEAILTGGEGGFTILVQDPSTSQWDTVYECGYTQYVNDQIYLDPYRYYIVMIDIDQIYEGYLFRLTHTI